MMITGLFAYVGPDTFLPVTSMLAAAAGVFMMFGRAGLRLIVHGRVVRAWSARRRRFDAPHAPARRRRTTVSIAPADATGERD